LGLALFLINLEGNDMSKCGDLKCRICHKAAHQIGGFLHRINKGELPSIWECRPTCDADLPQDVAMIMAIEGSDSAIKEGN
jgi:hypothetical protein